MMIKHSIMAGPKLMRRCIARTEAHIVSQSRRGSVLRAELSKRNNSESMDVYLENERKILAIQRDLYKGTT
tara:strand:+ start:2066 stop:2278 length:213 start_codon:yes stop_codon:yes gene_type:complete